MDITFSNNNTIKISGKSSSIIINPTSAVKADLLLFTDPSASRLEQKSFYGPGEYEVLGAMVDGIEIDKGNTAYSVVSDDIHITYIVDLLAPLSNTQLESMDGVDILIIAVKDDKADLLNKVISQVEPSVLIPIMIDESEIAKIKAEFGKDIEPMERYKITKKDLPLEAQELVLLK